MKEYLNNLPDEYWELEALLQSYVEGNCTLVQRQKVEQMMAEDSSIAYKVKRYQALESQLFVSELVKRQEEGQKKQHRFSHLYIIIGLIFVGIIGYGGWLKFQSAYSPSSCKELLNDFSVKIHIKEVSESSVKGVNTKIPSLGQQTSTYLTGLTFLDAQKVVQAESVFKTIIAQKDSSTNPHFADAQYFLGIVYMLEDSCSLALKQLKNTNAPQGFSPAYQSKTLIEQLNK
ncbi:MAG: hypothetical protein ACKVTZ_21855 [Bacteroidia bacterium]